MGTASFSDEVDSLLSAARNRPAPVYLFIGEPFQTEAAARRLIDTLVPAEQRSLNVESYDGRTASIASILDSLRMPGLFSGTKVIWVREPTLFLSGEKRADITSALFVAWAENRHTEAVERLLALAALAGWTQEQFAATDWASVTASQVSSFFGRSIDSEESGVLPAIHAACMEGHETVRAHRDDGGLLEDFLARGVPPNSVLVFTAAAVDRRKRVVKAIREHGAMAESTVQRERSGALTAESVAQLTGEVLSRHGKRLAPAGRRLLVQRAGNDPALLAMELEKLCLYTGDGTTISAEDVRISMRDLAESWIFDFTRALAQRTVAPAVIQLRALFEQGEHPLRLLPLIARELRLMLLARDCLADTLAGAWTPGVPFTTFRDRLLPMLSEAQRDAFGGLHPYVMYLCLQNAGRVSTAVLQRGLLGLQRLDIKLKTSAGDSRLLLEVFVLDMCRTHDAASPAAGIVDTR